MFEKINPQDCRYLEKYVDKLPVLVLAVRGEYSFNDKGKWKRKWLHIAHQTGGHACHQHYMIGTILQPKPEIAEKIQKINNEWLESDCGMFGVSLDELLKYRKQLNKLLDVDCNNSYLDFEEGIYPIDCSPDIVKKLALDSMPEDFDKFIKWKGSRLKILGIINRWHLYILGDNCD